MSSIKIENGSYYLFAALAIEAKAQAYNGHIKIHYDGDESYGTIIIAFEKATNIEKQGYMQEIKGLLVAFACGE